MPINFSLKMTLEELKSQLLLENSAHTFCTFYAFLNNILNSSHFCFDVNQEFSQKWRSKFSQANFCSKTVDTTFAVFVLLSTSFPINLIIIVLMLINYFLRNEGRSSQKQTLPRRQWPQLCCFCSSLNIFSNQFDC